MEEFKYLNRRAKWIHSLELVAILFFVGLAFAACNKSEMGCPVPNIVDITADQPILVSQIFDFDGITDGYFTVLGSVGSKASIKKDGGEYLWYKNRQEVGLSDSEVSFRDVGVYEVAWISTVCDTTMTTVDVR